MCSIKEKYAGGNNIIEIADELYLFWYQYKNVIELYLKSLSCNNNTYLFTGAGYLDVKNNEHFPFITMGQQHLIDDTLVRYLQKITDKSNTFF